MSMPLTVFVSGLGGVFTVMVFLLVMVTISSKIARAFEKKKDVSPQ